MKKIDSIINKIKKLQKPHKMAAVGVVAAIIGGLIKATALTQSFPEPYDSWGNLILFAALLLIIADIAIGGLYDKGI
jgi:hypothetical protein